MEAELTEMVGAKVYEEMVSLLEERDRLRQRGVPLPHPAVRGDPRQRRCDDGVGVELEGSGPVT